MAYGTKVAFEPVREVAFGSIGAAYAAVGTATTDYTRLIGCSNNTDAEIYVSFDGITNHLRLAASSFQLYDLTANAIHVGNFISQGTTIYVKRVSGAPTTGDAWFTVMYSQGGV